MALWRAIAWIYIFLMVAFVVASLPLVHSSTTPSFQGGRKVNGGAALTEGLFESNNQGRRVGGNVVKGADDLGIIGAEESAREVPTGPDPLHHNSINPEGP